jgi:PAS domain S-box-containing protein
MDRPDSSGGSGTPGPGDGVTDHSARLLAAIVESSDDAIVSKDLNGIVISWNRAAERMFGYTASEMIGRSIRLIIPADRQAEEDAVLASIQRGERVDHFETLRQRRDGSLVPISLTVSPVRDASGRVIGASKIARDVSERRRAEADAEHTARLDAFLAQLTTTLTSSLDYRKTLKAVVGFAVTQVADWCSAELVEDQGIVTLASAHAHPGQAAGTQFVLDRYAARTPASPGEVIRTGKAVFQPALSRADFLDAAGGDAELADLIGSLGFVSYIAVPMIAHGHTHGALTFASCRPDRPYTEKDFRFAHEVAACAALAIENGRAYDMVKTSSNLKDEFLATLSHELRTPLNAIMGYARLLRAGSLQPDRVAHALEVMDRNAGALSQIIEDVLDVSRIIAGKSRLQLQPVQLSDVIQDAIATIMPTADAKGVRVIADLSPQVPGIWGDPDRLLQVAWNLLTNAVKFTPAGGRVFVRTQIADGQASVTVTDTGAGIAAEFLPHLFERFRQADAGTTRRHGGLGLGLAIARHIIEMHGGTIEAESPGPGQGSTFRLLLPVRKDETVPAVQHPPLAARPAAGRRPESNLDLTGIHVLAVDDDRDALVLFREVLEAAGATVGTASSAVIALDRLQRERPTVLVADLGMPLIDGFDLMRRVRRLSDPVLRDIPAAALSAYARSEDRARALRSGFEVHLSKPVNPVELVAAVAALARKRTPAA